MTAAPVIPETERTAADEQMLVSGVRLFGGKNVPRTFSYSASPLADRLALRAAAPIAPNAEQKPCEVTCWRVGQGQQCGGLFDIAMRDQRDLIDAIRAAERGASLSTPTRKD